MIATPPSRSKSDSVAVIFGTFLVISNLVLQGLDWITTFIGFSRGLSEGDYDTRWLIAKTGNEYLGVSIEKTIYILIFVLCFFLMNVILRTKRRLLRPYAFVLLYLFMLGVLVVLVQTIVANFAALGP